MLRADGQERQTPDWNQAANSRRSGAAVEAEGIQRVQLCGHCSRGRDNDSQSALPLCQQVRTGESAGRALYTAILERAGKNQ